MAPPQPIAFMSYVHFDDQRENGRLTQFRDHLSAEVRVQTGEEFPIFQDRTDIHWGQSWKERLEESIDAVTFLIPIITPSYFRSQPCRDELQRFLSREKELNRSDLVLPVYYIDTSLLNDPARHATDELAQAIAARQWADWRDLRFEPFTSPEVGKRLAQMAVHIRDALERVQGRLLPSRSATASQGQDSGKARQPRGVGSRTVEQASKPVKEAAELARGPATRTEPLHYVVDQTGRGDHTTISEAIRAASPGDRILVRPGLYQEGLVINKPLEIIGDGALADIVVQATGVDTLSFQTTMARVAHLTLCQMGGGDWYCVDITQGRLIILEDCDITSQSLACVAIRGGADPRLHLNRIHHGDRGGIYIYDNGQGTLEDNHIYGNALAGVAIMGGGNPTLRRNHIYDGQQEGVYIDNNGQGTLEDNHIYGNALAGVAIRGRSSPTLRRNRINRNNDWAIWVSDKGGGIIEDNDLRNNARGAWYIAADSEALIKRARNQE
jgi:F-box protein 11